MTPETTGVSFRSNRILLSLIAHVRSLDPPLSILEGWFAYSDIQVN